MVIDFGIFVLIRSFILLWICDLKRNYKFTFIFEFELKSQLNLKVKLSFTFKNLSRKQSLNRQLNSIFQFQTEVTM